jgi:hypothetical protein
VDANAENSVGPAPRRHPFANAHGLRGITQGLTGSQGRGVGFVGVLPATVCHGLPSWVFAVFFLCRAAWSTRAIDPPTFRFSGAGQVFASHRAALPFPLSSPLPPGFFFGQYLRHVFSKEHFRGALKCRCKSGIPEPAVNSRPMHAGQPSSWGNGQPLPVGVEESLLPRVQPCPRISIY